MEQKPEIDTSRDPFSIFDEWYNQAAELEPNDPNAIALATCDADGQPSVRMVLLKDWDARGFVAYTNWQSRKGGELLANPKAGFCLYWKSTKRQIRVTGPVEQVSEAEADAYFASRYRDSRIGAHASEQSRPLDSRAALMARVEEMEARFDGVDNPPRPPHWTGLRIMPLEIEFWQEQPFRLHDRWVYRRARVGDDWTVTRLYP